ncbi:ankyrin repeat-containing domain protein [Corynascus novoguineensis]|uniref:Ankyrin repeat-containing domain protein n=1 Tax=Corynascus novoguineensis TaxID=1126955 RepID=A0AAN7CNQ6_9PEZI|nr:ankyrin repeat-containing domain protein [Corynascus novoguineensis]
MADPFGIIGVIGVIGQIAQITVKLGLDWKDIQTLKTVLSETLANILANDDFKNAFDGRHSTFLAQFEDTAKPTSSMVSACKQELDSLLDDLAKRTRGHRIGWERLKGAFLEKKTRETVENLQRQCRTLNSLMAVDSLVLTARIHSEVRKARKEQQGWQEDWENKSVLDWVTTVDYSSQQSDFIRRRQAGTGQWLLESKEYQQWIGTAKQTLFCPGIPGAGKTIQTSIVVDDLQVRFRDDVYVGIAYVYCNFRRHADQKVENLVSSLIRQLSQDQSSLPECLRILYDKHKGRIRPSLDELSKVLQTVGNLFSRIFIVIDALDECRLSDDSRSKFLTEIFALQSKTGANIFTTSRFILDITERFKHDLSLEIRALDLHKEIITKIVQVVDGMFLLASVKAVRAALETLHTGSQAYDHAYNDVMDRIEGQLKDQEQLAKQVISWITCAKRPLSTTELRHALGVEVGETELDPDNIPLVEDIVSVCVGLITVDEESNIIRLVHYTTQEYFERTWKRWFPNAQVDITDICATYLSFSSFESGSCRTDAEFEDRLRFNRLYDYAARYWGEHAREAGRTSQITLDFLRNGSLVEAQVQSMMTIKQPWSSESYSQKFPKNMQGLHLAAYFGILGAAETLLHSNSNNDLKNSFNRTPLSCASESGHEAVVKMLVDTGKVDIDSKDNNGRTPLLYASRSGNEAIVKVLVDTGKVDIDLRDIGGQTPLSYASTSGHKAVVKVLLDTGQVDIDSKEDFGRTPLSYAAWSGHEAVVEMLLNTGKVDIDSRDTDGRTPLSYAAWSGHEAVVKMLLDTGKVDVDSKSKDSRTPLSYAAERGHEAVVKTLLDTGKVDINSKNFDGWTPLSYAANRTPLSYAAVNGHTAVVKTLLNTGKVDVDSKDNDDRTPLLYAAWRGHEAVVKMLLGTGKVDINSKDKNGKTPLSYAAANRYKAVVKMLHYGHPHC